MILTVEEFREHVSTTLGDGPLMDLLDAAEAAIVGIAGQPHTSVEFFGGGHRLVALSRPAETITSITETNGTTPTTLDTDDYIIFPGGLLLERLTGGSNSRSRWYGRVTVTYVPVDDIALRIAAQLALVKLDMNRKPGSTRERIGAWEEEASTAEAYEETRDSILSTLRSPSMVVV